jgi:hypothetical protein
MYVTHSNTDIRVAELDGKPAAYVKLTGIYGVGKEAIVDPEDVDHMMFFSNGEPWTYSGGKGPDSRGHYVKKQIIDSDGNRIYELLHTWIMQPPKGKVVDHINGNTLDNRRSNLRIASHSENSHNRISYAKSGYRGIEARPNGKHRASVHIGGERKLFKTFATRKEAVAARNAVLEEHKIFIHKSKRKSVSRDVTKFF